MIFFKTFLYTIIFINFSGTATESNGKCFVCLCVRARHPVFKLILLRNLIETNYTDDDYSEFALSNDVVLNENVDVDPICETLNCNNITNCLDYDYDDVNNNLTLKLCCTKCNKNIM